MFDAQVDSIFFALMALHFKTLKIMITESGWPNKGAAKETGATPDNAQTYNTNLIRHVVNDSGTPAKPGEEIDVYIFSLFNENRKPGIESERNWGLFFPDKSSIYSLDWTGRGNVDVMTGANITSANGTWCIASTNASETDLQNALNWACGPGNVDCSAIQPSQPCYQPDTLASHASYAFNSYYQQNGANVVACDFGGAGIRTTKDPSKNPILVTVMMIMMLCLVSFDNIHVHIIRVWSMSLVDVAVIYISCSYGMMVVAFTSTPSVPNRKTLWLF